MLPDAETLALAWLRSRPDLRAVRFGTEAPADLLARLPYVAVTRIGGAADLPSWRGGALLDRAGINVQGWAAPYRADARRLVYAVVLALCDARGTALPDGVIVRVSMLAGPTALPDPGAPDFVHRFTATCQITARALTPRSTPDGA